MYEKFTKEQRRTAKPIKGGKNGRKVPEPIGRNTDLFKMWCERMSIRHAHESDLKTTIFWIPGYFTGRQKIKNFKKQTAEKNRLQSHFPVTKNALGLSETITVQWTLCGPAVYFVLTNGDLRQREWTFCSSVISQKV